MALTHQMPTLRSFKRKKPLAPTAPQYDATGVKYGTVEQATHLVPQAPNTGAVPALSRPPIDDRTQPGPVEIPGDPKPPITPVAGPGGQIDPNDQPVTGALTEANEFWNLVNQMVSAGISYDLAYNLATQHYQNRNPNYVPPEKGTGPQAGGDTMADREKNKQEGLNQVESWIAAIMENSNISREWAIWELYVTGGDQAKQVFDALGWTPQKPEGYRGPSERQAGTGGQAESGPTPPSAPYPDWVNQQMTQWEQTNPWDAGVRYVFGVGTVNGHDEIWGLQPGTQPPAWWSEEFKAKVMAHRNHSVLKSEIMAEWERVRGERRSWFNTQRPPGSPGAGVGA